MKCLRMVSFVVLAGKLACASDGAAVLEKSPRVETNRAETSNRPSSPTVRLPRVLRSLEPADSRIVMLPGPIVRKQAAASVPALVPAPPPAPILVAPGWHPQSVPVLPPAPEVALARTVPNIGNLGGLASAMPAPPHFPTPEPSPALAVSDPAGDAALSTETEAAPLSAPTDGENVPLDLVTPPAAPRARIAPPALPLEPHKPAYPAGLATESAVFCQKQIGHWTLADARAILGEPQRQRPAIEDDSTENGHIYAFRDLTSRYKELELDFGKESGLLRSVFVYPWNLTWQDCRKLWGAHVSATEGNQGRIFYSYVNRHLDVLVEHDGKVISLGLY
jgi:hypothetical protein